MNKKNFEGAKIYAENAIRFQAQATNYLKLSSRLDAVASRLETEIRMNQVSRSMGAIVQGLDKAMASMDMQKITAVMDRFEQQVEDLDVRSQYMETTFNKTTTLTTPQDQVDSLIQQVAAENGLELEEKFQSAKPSKVTGTPVKEQDELSDRLAKLKSV